jgi:hypothetical protein
MAQAVSRRALTTEARVRSRVSPRGICGGQSATGTGTSVFPCQFHSTDVPLKWESRKKPHHLHHRVAQWASRLRYVRSVCCGLFTKRKGCIILNTRMISGLTAEGSYHCLTWTNAPAFAWRHWRKPRNLRMSGLRTEISIRDLFE